MKTNLGNAEYGFTVLLYKFKFMPAQLLEGYNSVG